MLHCCYLIEDDEIFPIEDDEGSVCSPEVWFVLACVQHAAARHCHPVPFVLSNDVKLRYRSFFSGGRQRS